MSVQTEIDRISTAVQNAHLKVIEKGGTSTAPYLVGNLASAIDTIPEATAPKLQAKTATPSETAQTVKPDSGYDGLSQVSVGAISKTYVGSGVTKQAAKTITPSTSSQTAVASGVYTTGAVTVGAIPSTYVKPTATKAATTYTPSTSNQTIAAGTYCSGAQTIKGDSNLVAGNIKSGVSIFGVAGSYEGSGGSSGGGIETCTLVLSAPSSGLRPQYYAYVKSDDGVNIEVVSKSGNASSSVTFENVVCKSVVAVKWASSSLGTKCTNCSMIFLISGSGAYNINCPAGGTATIEALL